MAARKRSMPDSLSRARARVEGIQNLNVDPRVCLLSGHDVYQALKNEKIIIPACNVRIRHCIPGIMRALQEKEAVGIFEWAPIEGEIEEGWTDMTGPTYFRTVLDCAQEQNFTMPFVLHGDHVTVTNASSEEIEKTRKIIDMQLKVGCTSIAIDASYNPVPDNINIVTALSPPITENGFGLEVEEGEISKDKALSTVENCQLLISGLNRRGIVPNLLAINNGSKHGNYRPGEEVHINLERTKEIHEAVGIGIAQHGITGTPIHLMGEFPDYGIKKGNIATHWVNLALKYYPRDLMEEAERWCQENNEEMSKNAIRHFRLNEIDIGNEARQRIEEESYRSACEILKAFRAEGSARTLAQKLPEE